MLGRRITAIYVDDLDASDAQMQLACEEVLLVLDDGDAAVDIGVRGNTGYLDVHGLDSDSFSRLRLDAGGFLRWEQGRAADLVGHRLGDLCLGVTSVAEEVVGASLLRRVNISILRVDADGESLEIRGEGDHLLIPRGPFLDHGEGWNCASAV